MKKPATKAEKDHMDAVAALGCIVCRDMGYYDTPAEIHHVLNGGVRASHYETIPLCPTHHRHGSFGEAVHNGTRTWEANYGTQRKLLSKTLTLLKNGA